MLSFELSAIDIALTMAVIILFILYLTKPSKKVTAKTQLPLDRKILRKGRASAVEMSKQSGRTDVWKCPHSFGHLGNLPKDASIPNECLTCPRVMECSFKGD